MRVSAKWAVLSLSFVAISAAGCSGGGGAHDHVPVAVDDSATTLEDTAVDVDVLANDTDADANDLLAVTGVTAPASGEAVIVSGGHIRYTPDLGFNGSDTFAYTLSDGRPMTATANVAVTVTAVNDPPSAFTDSYSTAEDTALTVAAANGVLANDTDSDSTALTAVLVATTTNGTLVLSADGSFSYVPAANYNGLDSFTYKANDGTNDSGVVTVSLTITAVNDAPVAVNDAYTTAEDTALVKAAAAGVLANDTDVEGSTLSATVVAAPTHGTLSLAANGSFTYVPAANYNGADSFTYKANDGTADSTAATVALTITAINDAPVAGNDAYSTNEDVALTVAAPGVLANDSDVDSSTLTAAVATAPASGSVAVNADGSFGAWSYALVKKMTEVNEAVQRAAG